MQLLRGKKRDFAFVTVLLHQFRTIEQQVVRMNERSRERRFAAIHTRPNGMYNEDSGL